MTEMNIAEQIAESIISVLPINNRCGEIISKIDKDILKRLSEEIKSK